jgi:hypothetical protein
MGRPIMQYIVGLAICAVTMSAADVTGIWTGQMTGRRGEKEDVSFQFRLKGNAVTGTMFGDEFDLALEDGSLSGDQVKFIVTTTNYYSGTQTKIQYTGLVKGSEMELTRERLGPPPTENPRNRQNVKQTFTIKRLTDR